jgi:hypothetical protein
MHLAGVCRNACFPKYWGSTELRTLGGFILNKGVGSLPKNLDYGNDPVKQALLNALPRLLGGYARTPGIDAVIVIVDVDSRECKNFLAELKKLAAKKIANT